MRGFRKFLIGFTSLLFSVGLWIAISLTQNHQKIISFPIELKNIPSNYSLSKNIPKEIYLTINGTGWDLFFLKLTQGLAYRVDVTGLPKIFNFRTNKNIYHYLKIDEKLNIISINPEKINLNFEEKATKIVPIKQRIAIDYKTNFSQTGDFIIEPDSVEVSGAPSLLKNINFWNTELQTFKNVNEDVYAIFKLSDTLSFSLNTNINAVKISWKVVAVSEKLLKNIPITFVDVPKNLFFRSVPSTINILFRGPSEEILNLNSENIQAQIFYLDILNDSTGNLKPNINIPKNISLVSINPNKIHYFQRKN